MRHIWDRIAVIGLDGASSPSDVKYVSLLNCMAFTGALFGFGFLPVLLIAVPKTSILIAILLTAIALSFSVLILTRFKLYLQGKLLFNLSASVAYAVLALLAGGESNAQLHLILVVIVSFFIYSPKEASYMYAVVFTAFIVFLGLEAWFYGHKGFLGLEPGVLGPIETAVNIGLFVYIMGFSYYIYTIFLRSETRLEEEKIKSENLLLNILPEKIAHRLKSSPGTIADGFEYVTVLFSDIVGFTTISERVPPEDLVRLLNEVFSSFDDLVDKYGLEKVKTIGDSYMVAAGIPTFREDHAEAAADFAVEIMKKLGDFVDDEGNCLRMRIGIHTGSMVAGVIGKKKFVYDLWGDSVNTAARMESHGIPGEIQVTHTTYELLRDKFVFEERGPIRIKGKGEMRTYLLKGRKI